ncbi:DUF6517 family protein [Halovenus rubra]|uniref:DUF6517 family protein n=2 Tax=Halovenus rubra TaxID=869890 RepID=A0ACC7DXG7_9EURY|nr:DUF6517 family protein [Halovenus rubra]
MGSEDESTDENQSSGDELAEGANDTAKPDEESSEPAEESGTEEGDTTSIATLKKHVTRRRVFGGIALVVLIVLLALMVVVPSSLLALVYSSSAEFEAQPATAQADNFTAGEYEQVGQDELVVEEQRAVLGQTKTVVTTNYVTDYERSIEVQRESFDGAVFTLVSTPAIEVVGNPLNPLAGMSHQELLSEFGDELEGDYAGLDDLQKAEEHDGVVQGKQTTISQFATTVERDGEEITVYLYVGTVRSGGDIVVAVGGHPAPFAQERASIFELMAGVEHPSE